jgi:hypothetical protein
LGVSLQNKGEKIVSDIFVTSGLTILGGIVIFVGGQILTKFIVEPFYEQSKLIGEIANSLIYYANVGAGVEPYYFQQLQAISKQDNLEEIVKKLMIERYEELIRNESKQLREATIVLRQQASQLMGRTNAIPFYGLWVVLSLGFLPARETVIEASQELIGLSNDTSKNTDRARKIAKCLRIKIISERFGKG